MTTSTKTTDLQIPIEEVKIDDELLFDSKIVQKMTMQGDILRIITLFEVRELKLLYRASVNGFGAKNFHQCCDNKGPTIIIIKSNHNRIFGGFTDIDWTTPEKHKQVMGRGNTFVFTFQKDKFGIRSLHRMKCVQGHYEVSHYPEGGPCFGSNEFLMLHGGQSGQTLPYSISKNKTRKAGSDALYIAGSEFFNVVELEVYSVKSIDDPTDSPKKSRRKKLKTKT